MRTMISTVLLLSALAFTSCAHKGHHHDAHHDGRSKAGMSCCQSQKKNCEDGSCKLKKNGKKDCKDGSCKLKKNQKKDCH